MRNHPRFKYIMQLCVFGFAACQIAITYAQAQINNGPVASLKSLKQMV